MSGNAEIKVIPPAKIEKEEVVAETIKKTGNKPFNQEDLLKRIAAIIAKNEK